ncbi:MAG: Sugar kinase of the family, may containing an N-terminal domain [Pseudonocardiales bacterium]|nr:Sugar kinase of the family, may containing an N-terminal domain [Pseudonocardiales bacterium]
MTRVGVARPDAIRRHNLGLLLTQVHRDGEITRAQLTRRLHLSRSTIGALVADLTELGLVDERVPSGGKRAGRPSHVVGPRADGPYAIAVDVDITHVTSAAIGIGGEVLARHVVATANGPRRPRQAAALVDEAVRELSKRVDPGARPVGIGVSVPGTVSRRTGTVEFAPNLEWRHEAFGEMLAEVVPPELPVYVGNDADLAVLAEHLRGNARDCDDVVYLMGRIGVGAGIIVNGRPLRGHDGHAGEVGHNVVDASGPQCHCGKRGCVETYIGENALLALAGRNVLPTQESIAAVFADASAGDEAAASAVRTVADALGRTVASLVNVLNPERVLLGGSLAGVLEFARDEIVRSVDRFGMGASRHSVQLCTPDLGDDSPLLGAAELAFADLLTDPVGTR